MSDAYIYVAGPIDQAGDWRAETKAGDWLRREGVSTYWPRDAWLLGGQWPTEGIGRVNRAALVGAAGVLAFLPSEIVTWGTPVEIETAVAELGIPVAIVVEVGEASVALAEWRRRGALVTNEWEEAVVWLLEQLEVKRKQESGQDGVIRFGSMTGMQIDEAWLVGQAPKKQVLWTGQGLRIGRAGDAGWDLYVAERTICRAGTFTDVSAGTKVALPEGVWGWVVGRSSTLRSRGLLVNQGIIDQGWRGDLLVGVWNLQRPGGPDGREWGDVTLEAGERIAQLIPLPQLTRELELWEWQGGHGERGETMWGEGETWGDRGEQGFGSSGL